jgi:hypothetical protein
VEDCNKYIKICASSWSLAKVILRCTVSETQKNVISHVSFSAVQAFHPLFYFLSLTASGYKFWYPEWAITMVPVTGIMNLNKNYFISFYRMNNLKFVQHTIFSLINKLILLPLGLRCPGLLHQSLPPPNPTSTAPRCCL